MSISGDSPRSMTEPSPYCLDISFNTDSKALLSPNSLLSISFLAMYVKICILYLKIKKRDNNYLSKYILASYMNK